MQKIPKKWCQLLKIEHLVALLPLHSLPFLHTGQFFCFHPTSQMKALLGENYPLPWHGGCGYNVVGFGYEVFCCSCEVRGHITAQHWQEMALKSSVTQMMPLSLYAVRQSPYLVWVIPVSRSSNRYHFMLMITIPFNNSYQTEPRILAHITINKLSRTKRKQ